MKVPRPPRSRFVVYVSLAALGLYAMYPGVAAAQFDALAGSVGGMSQGWFSTIQGLVKPTFTIVATLELCWAAALWAFERESFNALGAEIIKKVVTHGFFYMVMIYAGDWVPLITQSFVNAGEAVVGNVSTDKIIQDGMDVIGDLWGNVLGGVTLEMMADFDEIAGTSIPIGNYLLDLGEAQLLVTGITAIVIAFAYLVTAAQFFLMQIEAYVLFAAGAMYLGFGGASWGKDYVMKYLNYAINAGVRLLVLILTLSLTLSQVSSASGFFAFDIVAELKLMGLAILQAVLAVKAPDMAGGLMGFPGSGLTANGVFSSALNTVSQVQMITMAMRGGMGGAAKGHEGSGAGHGPGGGGSGPSHDVGRAASMGSGERGAAAPGAQALNDARNAVNSAVRGLDAAANVPGVNLGPTLENLRRTSDTLDRAAQAAERPPLPPRPGSNGSGGEGA